MMLDYILTLTGLEARDDNEDFVDSTLELLRTQTLALSTCTTLVSVEPKLMVETQNHVMKAMLGFCALPNDSVDVVNPRIDNLIALLRAILLRRIIKLSGEDGRSRAEQLLHMLRQIDQYVSSQVEYQSEEVVGQYMRCFSAFSSLGRFASVDIVRWAAGKQVGYTVHGNFSNLPCKIVY